MIRFLFYCMAILSPVVITAQDSELYKPQLRGKVVDENEKPVGYVDVMVKLNDKVVDAILTMEDGSFELHPEVQSKDVYSLTIEVQGLNYQAYSAPVIPEERLVWNLGTIVMKENLNEIEGISLVAEKKSVKYEIDKKVVDVQELKTDVSGSVANVLQNVPSVAVDAEGNVSLRGQSNFKVYIDGKPSILDGSDALNQVPAAMVKNIEIITNPSARYEAEGSGGIINIITDKKKAAGYSGKVAANYGTFNTGGGEGFFQIRKGGYEFVVSSTFNKRIFKRNFNSENTIRQGVGLYSVKNDGEREFNMGRREISSSLTKFFGEHNSFLSIDGRFGKRDFAIYRNTNTLRNTIKSTSSSTLDIDADYIGINQTGKLIWSEGNQFVDYMVSYRSLDKTEKKWFSEMVNNKQSDGQNVNEVGQGKRTRITVDYTYDIDKESATKLEVGLFYNKTNDDLDQTFSRFDKVQSQLVKDEKNTRILTVVNDIYAAYISVQSQVENFGYKLGLRAEQFYRDIQSRAANIDADANLFNWFPTAHFSYNFSETVQTYLSYARRINRPRGWQVEPIEVWMDANNIFRGNKDLLPSFEHSAEFGLSYDFMKGANFFTEIFYSYTEDTFEFISSNYDVTKGTIQTDRKDVLVRSSTNVGDQEFLGFESGARFPIGELLMTNWSFSGYNQRVIPYSGSKLVKSSEIFTWNTNVNIQAKLPLDMTFTTNWNYDGQQNNLQGTTDPFYEVDFSVKGNLGFGFFENEPSVWNDIKYNFMIRDVLGSGNRKEVNNFATSRSVQEDSPVQAFFNFSLSYVFNNFRNKRRGERMDVQ